MAEALRLFEALLSGSPISSAMQLTAGDCVAFPFLKYAAQRDPADDELFHRVLQDYQPLGDSHPNLRAWIERVDAHTPRPVVPRLQVQLERTSYCARRDRARMGARDRRG